MRVQQGRIVQNAPLPLCLPPLWSCGVQRDYESDMADIHKLKNLILNKGHWAPEIVTQNVSTTAYRATVYSAAV